MNMFAVLLVALAIDGRPDQIVLDTVVSEQCIGEPGRVTASIASRLTHATALEVIDHSDLARRSNWAEEFLMVSVFIRPSEGGCTLDIALQDGYLRSSDQHPVLDGQYMYAVQFNEADAETHFYNLQQRVEERVGWVVTGFDGRR